MKKLHIVIFLLLSLFLFSQISCQHVETVYKDVPEDCVIIKRETLQAMIHELIHQKALLLDCLERERAAKD
jgi:hypothetical protein